MRIAQSAQQFQVQHQAQQSSQHTERLEVRRGTPNANTAALPRTSPAPNPLATPGTRLSLSPAALAQSNPSSAPRRAAMAEPAVADSTEASASGKIGTTLTPQMAMLKDLIERMMGASVEVYADKLQAQLQAMASQRSTAGVSAAPAGNAAAAGTGWGLVHETSTVRQESEQLRFQMQGQVQTADGQTIRFELDLQLQRSYREESSTRIALGSAAAPVDPLVLRFDGPAQALQNQRFAFDLQGDGSADNVPLLAQGWGYLALDRNQNGRIDDGLELFGPRTDNGFAELAALDDDGNGWIDEGDAAFKDLRIWRPSADGGGSLQTLQAEGVGALGLANAATPFALRTEGNASLGALRATGAYLREDGQAGVLQQIDLAV